MKILAIFDNGGKTQDRYTIVTDSISGKWYNMLGLSSNPSDYNGFSQWGNGQYTRDGDNSHLGQRVHLEDLAGSLQSHIATQVFGGNV